MRDSTGRDANYKMKERRNKDRRNTEARQLAKTKALALSYLVMSFVRHYIELTFVIGLAMQGNRLKLHDFRCVVGLERICYCEQGRSLYT